MSSGAALEMFWDGKALRPAGSSWERRAAKEFTEGEIYHMVQQEPRSMASHGHYFAAVQNAWRSLPEIFADRFPTADHLRKYALIRTGWYNSNSITGTSHESALKLASFIRPLDEFAVVDVTASVVTVFTAKTQSFRMGNEEFQKSKTDVLEFIAHLIGVSPKQLASQGAEV